MIEPIVFTDHKVVTFNVNIGMVRHSLNKDYWKLNKLLLQNKELKKETQKIIDRYWSQANLLNNFGNCWELMKYEIRNLALFFWETDC